MKTKYLDVKNCHELLPKSPGAQFIQRLEICLAGINESKSPSRGAIDLLIERNRNTLNGPRGSGRLCISPVEISQTFIVAESGIQTDAVMRPPIRPALVHTNIEYSNGLVWKTLIPLQFLLKGWGDAASGHQCYVHSISQNMQAMESIEGRIARRLADSDDYYYVGITGRNWLLRLGEHLGEMHRGSRKNFHAMWRDSLGLKDVVFSSALRQVNLSYEQAMNWEEEGVKHIAYGPNGLNMIPGGFAGLKYLHKLGIIARTNISLAEREKAIALFVEKYPRKGIPNPFIAALWQDDDFYARIMGAKAKTLSLDQVRQIRGLAATGMAVKEITKEVRALNELQVKNVIIGKTYTRYE